MFVVNGDESEIIVVEVCFKKGLVFVVDIKVCVFVVVE